jgi:uridine kinase
VAHTDDFASWQEPVDWWPRCLRDLLEPLARGDAARYVPTAWGGEPRDAVEIPSGGTIVLEGVTASREAFRPSLTFAIWIETPRDLCLRRGLERDGAAARAQWERSLAKEDGYIERERPYEHADAIIRGDG